MKQLDTFVGRCFTLTSDCPFDHSDTLALVFNMTVPRMSLHLHHPRAALGLNANLWPSPVETVALSAEESVDLALGLSITETISQEEDGGGRAMEEEFFDCVYKTMADNFTKALEEKALCFFPIFGSVLESLDNKSSPALPLCKSMRQVLLSYRRTYEILYGGMFDSPCGGTELSHYHCSRTDLPPNALLLGGRSVAYLYYRTTDVVAEREVELMDRAALVSAVGGCVGIFLGWSILDLAKLSREMFC